MVFRGNKKQSKEVYLYDPIGADKDGNTIRLLDVCIAEDADILEQIEEEMSLEKLQSYMEHILTEREQEILVLRFGLNGNPETTQREIAEKLHISRSYVSRIEKKALQKLKAAYE